MSENENMRTIAKPKIKGGVFTRILRETIRRNPAIKGTNYAIVRQEVSKKLNLSKSEFDQFLGFLIGTGKLKNVWLFTGHGQVKVYHANMNHLKPFDSIEEEGEGIRYFREDEGEEE